MAIFCRYRPTSELFSSDKKGAVAKNTLRLAPVRTVRKNTEKFQNFKKGMVHVCTLSRIFSELFIPIVDLSPGGLGNGSGVVSRASASPSNGAGNWSGGSSRYTSASPSNGGGGAGSDGNNS